MEKMRKSILDKGRKIGVDTKALSEEVLMTETLPWEKAWQSFQEQVIDSQTGALKRSSAAALGHKLKVTGTKEKKWSLGEDFKDRFLKSKAKLRVLSELELVTGKEITKAQSVLSSIVADLTNEKDFNELSVLSEDTKSDLSTIFASISSASDAIGKMAKSTTLATAKVLTAVTAVLLPPSCLDKRNKAARTDFCNVFSINGRSKYFESAVKNRTEYNTFLKQDDDISTGEKVSCRDSPEARVTAIGDDDSVTVSLLPFGTAKKYTSLSKGKIRRFEPDLTAYDRRTRFDTTPIYIIDSIEQFYRRYVPISPNTRDVVKRRHPLHPAQFEMKQAMLRYQTINELWQQFMDDHHELAIGMKNPKMPNTAPMLFRTHAPWEMRKAQDSGCLCKSCYSFHLLRRGVTGACAAIVKVLARIGTGENLSSQAVSQKHVLEKIKDVIETPSKYDTVVKCLQPCLASGKLEDASYKCLIGECAGKSGGNGCSICGFRQWWSNDLKKELLNSDGSMNLDAPLAGEEWTTPEIDWRYFTSVARPTIASHAQEISVEAAGDEDYRKTQNTSRTLCQATRRGTLIDFLNEFEIESQKHAYHRNIVSTEQRAQLEYERNVRPLIVRRDIDYSENGSIKDPEQIQSQYWATIGYTLFVSIASWLEAKEWNKTTGSLPIGAEVTVNGELTGDNVNMESFWAVVTSVDKEDKNLYEVTDAEGKKHMFPRSLLRHRKRHSVATGHITDDKTHDRHAMQKFTDDEMKYLETYMNEYFPEDIPKKKITHLHQHSDNAVHFKSTGAIHYFTTLINDRGGASETAFVYSFGAPGHGKGPFDGIGGRWKNKILQAMRSAHGKKASLPFTDSGYIHTVEDVYKALVYYFSNATKKDSQLAGKNPIHHYHFIYHPIEKDPIKRPEESFVTLDGISKHYQMVVKNTGCIYWRKRSCWCLPCENELSKGTLEWGQDHQIANCNASNGSVEHCNSMYLFEKRVCTKTVGPGVTRQVRISTEDRNEAAEKLDVGDFVIFDKHDDELEPIWLGRVMPNPEWQGHGVHKNESSRKMNFRGVGVDKGEVAIYVMWYEKINVMSDQLEYWVSRSESEPIVQNNKYLIPFVEVKMHNMSGQNNRVPKLRKDDKKRMREWHSKEIDIIWNMDSGLRRKALALCDDE